MTSLRLAFLGFLAWFGPPAFAQSDAAGPLVTAEEWASYAAHYVTEDGRVIDDANGGISHSEGQGYGLLLAYFANDPVAFDLIWGFTQRELMIRDDSLLAWRWEPDAEPHITDLNNATDGDILVAYALGLAAYGWEQEDKLAMARDIALAVGQQATLHWRGRDYLLPGTFGFEVGDRADGPVVNLSYWVFEAFPMLGRLAPETDWLGLTQSGRQLIASAQFGTARLPADWISLAGSEPRPAEGFAPEFGYNAIRIPLYLLRAGQTEPALLEHFSEFFNANGGPATALVDSGWVINPLTEPGYRAIAAAVDCALHGTPLPQELQTFAPTTYYGSTLHLLVLSYLRQQAPQCLRDLSR